MKSKKSIATILVVLLAMVAGMSFACDSESEPETGVITFGIATPLSGPAAPWGIPHLRSAELVFDQVNEEGGVTIDGTTYTFEAKAYDTKFVLEDTVSAVNRLIFEDGVEYISVIDPVGPVIDILAENNILSINIGGQWYAVDKDKPLMFLAMSQVDQLAAAFYPFFADMNPDIKTRAAIVPDTDTGRFVEHGAKLVCEALGIETVHEEYFEPTAMDFSSIALRVIDEDPDWVDPIPPPPGQSATIVKQLREAGFEGAIATSVSIGEVETYVGIAGEENAEGMMGWGIAPEAYTPEIRDWVDRYIDKYGGPFDPMTIMWANAPISFVDGIKHAESLEPEDIADALRSPDFEGRALFCDYYYGGEDIYGIANMMIQSVIPFHRIGENGQDEHLLWAKDEDFMPLVQQYEAIETYVTEELGLPYP